MIFGELLGQFLRGNCHLMCCFRWFSHARFHLLRGFPSHGADDCPSVLARRTFLPSETCWTLSDTQRSSVGEMFSRMAAVLYQRVRGFLWFSRAASGMYAPGHGKVSIPLPGLDHSSQRAEIAALLLAVKTFRGPIHFFSDCTIAVKGFLILYKGNRLFKLQPAMFGQFWPVVRNSKHL